MSSSHAPSFGRGSWYLVIAAVIWGTGGPAAAVLYARTGLGPVAVSFWRFAVAALLLTAAWPWLRGTAPGLAAQLRAAPVRTLARGLVLAVCQTTYFVAVGATGVAVATLVALGAGPALTAAGARLWFGEPFTRTDALAAVAATAGLVLLVLGEHGGPGGASLTGIGFAVLAALTYAAVTLLNRATAHPIGGATLTFTVGAVALLPTVFLVPVLPTAPGLAVGLLGYLGAGPSALGYVLFFTGLTTVRAAPAAVIVLLEPLTAAVLGVAVLGERLTPLMVAGAALLMAAVAATAVLRNGSTR